MLGAAALATALGWAVSVRRAPPARRAALPHLARVHRELRLPRAARARDADRPARAERRASSSRRRSGSSSRAPSPRCRRSSSRRSARATSCGTRALLLGGLCRCSWRLGASSRSPSCRRSTTRSPRSSSTAGSSCSPRSASALYGARRARLRPPLPAPPRALRLRVHARVRAARRGDGRDRVGAELAALVVGVARAHARRVRRHRRRPRAREWHEERFSALYLDETLAGAKDVSILLADLQGFTSFSERHDPAEVAAMLNAYFERARPADGARRRRGAPDRRRRADGHLRQGRRRPGPRGARGARGPAAPAARRRVSRRATTTGRASASA